MIFLNKNFHFNFLLIVDFYKEDLHLFSWIELKLCIFHFHHNPTHIFCCRNFGGLFTRDHAPALLKNPITILRITIIKHFNNISRSRNSLVLSLQSSGIFYLSEWIFINLLLKVGKFWTYAIVLQIQCPENRNKSEKTEVLSIINIT